MLHVCALVELGNRGSYMSVPVLLNQDVFPNVFNKFNNTGALVYYKMFYLSYGNEIAFN